MLNELLQSAVFRHIPDHVPTLADLGYPDLFAELTKASNGLILLTGPTDSRKSTTLNYYNGFAGATKGNIILEGEKP